MRTRPTGRARLQGTALAPLAAGLLLALTGCGGDGGGRAEDQSTSSSTASAAPTPGTTSSTAADDGRYPEFGPEDYVYRLEVLCFCPQVGAVRIEVEDGEVTAATSAGGPGVKKGTPAPDFARLTINDIIAVANDPAVDEVEVTWPDGQAHPSVVEVDRLANAVDDEVTYTIKAVRVR
ncbi:MULTISPECIES: DUF6174 domain-containing protein [Nocardioides]|uniref:DUF6174 domain-containing protein n=1 Tax=Nocardioides vastitatis TaxID=2568655 RepID=A0ABW0ZCX5_9ACTN|nr:DUF6174 domain-containing protein [Nocardioides sp.]THI93491.1 hypothetical protein E7Z54_20885 [Nocardioides sp.]